jgi:hypothetical protein
MHKAMASLVDVAAIKKIIRLMTSAKYLSWIQQATGVQ